MIDFIGLIGMFLAVPCFSLLCLARLVVLVRDWSDARFRLLRLFGLLLMLGLQLCCYLSFYPFLIKDITGQ